MNKKISRRNLNRKATSAMTWLVGVAALGLPGAYAADEPKKEEPKKEEAPADDSELRNWIEVGVGGNFVHGDKSAFQQRTQQPRDVWGGVTDFHYELDVGKKSLFEVDGRGIFDAHNYSITLSYKDPDHGYARAGFEEFRNYYDLSGGYFPGNGAFFDLYPDVGEIDRRKIFFEAGLTLENIPQVRIRYDYDDRAGTKNSTSWGDTTAIGIAGQTRKIVPSLNAIDEDRHTISLEISHTIGNTLAGIGGSYSVSTYDNARYMRRSPGEPSDRFLTHRESVDNDILNGRAWTETDFNEQVKFTTAYSYTRMDADVGGSRAIGGSFDADPSPAALGAFARRQTRDHGFDSLSGGTQIDQHVGAISLMYRPTPDITIVPSLRIESQDQKGDSSFQDIEVAGGGGITTEDVVATRQRDLLDVSESIEARYTGITNWVFYARAELLQGTGNLREAEIALSDPTAPAIQRESDSTRFTQKYTIGANWYPAKQLNLAVQAFHRDRENEYDHILDSTPPVTPATGQGYYPAFIEKQQFVTEDANIRVTYRPLNNLTLVTRYDFQYTTIDSDMQLLPEVESARSTAHILTESITWVPMNRLYLQISGSYTWDHLASDANEILPRVQVSKNDYYTVGATVGFALTDKTDVSASYTFYRAENYDPSIFAEGLPFNASLEEHMVGGAVVHRFNRRMQLTTRYAFITAHDETSGGNNDFDAHLLSTALRFRF
jgi:hypothetical protein